MKFSEFILTENAKIQDIKSVVKYLKEIQKLCKELEKIEHFFDDEVDWEGDFKRLKVRDFKELISRYVYRWSIIGDPNRRDSKNGKFVDAGAKGLKVVKQIKELMDKVDSLASKNGWNGHSWDPEDYGTESFPEMIEDTLEHWERILKQEAGAKRK